jgi:hypothetical protein
LEIFSHLASSASVISCVFMVILLSAVGGVLWLGANFECARF